MEEFTKRTTGERDIVTSRMVYGSVNELFSRAATSRRGPLLGDSCNLIDHVAGRGIKRFKRRALGFCRARNTITLDRLADILCELNMAESREDALEIAPQLDGASLLYGTIYTGRTVVDIKRVKTDNKEFYEILAMPLHF